MTDEFSWETEYRDKFGRIIGCDEMEVLLRNNEYRIVKQDIVGDYSVSTVWLGVPEDMGTRYFETCVFKCLEKDPLKVDYSEELDCRRYENISQAEVGHAEMVKKWREKQKK